MESKSSENILSPERLEDWATSLRLTMADICREAGVAYSTWWRWRTGRRGIGTGVYIRLVDALKALRDGEEREE